MRGVAIRVEKLGKRYRLGERAPYKTVREAVARAAAAPFRTLRSQTRSEPSAEDGRHIWALKNVDLEVRQGEAVGIIGRNGSGKSTLLKILARITEPTIGRAEISGQVGSLLEVGTGFHPELTGRENVYLNGAILGMSRADIRCRFDEIVAFSEIQKFLDTPVKHYSSGMYVRLAFAVAAHLDPDILLLDEILAVGDHAFREKCYARLREVRTSERTVVLVSHDMASVQNLCSRAVWLEGGRVQVEGAPNDVAKQYLASTTPPG